MLVCIIPFLEAQELKTAGYKPDKSLLLVSDISIMTDYLKTLNEVNK